MMKDTKLTSASVIENPLDVEMQRFIFGEQAGEVEIIEVVIPPGGSIKIRDVLTDLETDPCGPFVFKGVCPPGTTEETLHKIAAGMDAEMVEVATKSTGDAKGDCGPVVV